jgi:hypothetical protein
MIILALTAALAIQAPNLDQTTRLLRTKDQALLDAYAPGDRKVWGNALALNAVYVDENGAIMNRDEFLKQLEPLPTGASGSIQIVSYSVHFSGDLATVVHTDENRRITTARPCSRAIS